MLLTLFKDSPFRSGTLDGPAIASFERDINRFVPATLVIIFVLLCMIFQRLDEALLIMATLPFALAGGIRLLWALGHNGSVASAVGFVALAGVAEFGVIMLAYLKHAWDGRVAKGQTTIQGLDGCHSRGRCPARAAAAR